MSSLALGTALWLGLLTAVSPCPLASNLAAISFLGRHIRRRRDVLFSGALYTLGRALAYLALGLLITVGLTATDSLSRFLQNTMNLLLGPVLIVAGLVLMEAVRWKGTFNVAGSSWRARAERRGVLWALPLGVLFALSFCPVSAGLFFGGLIPLALRQASPIALPAAFGIGTALPVFVFAVLLAYSSQAAAKAFDRIGAVEGGLRKAVGVIFIAVGIMYSLVHVYGFRW